MPLYSPQDYVNTMSLPVPGIKLCPQSEDFADCKYYDAPASLCL